MAHGALLARHLAPVPGRSSSMAFEDDGVQDEDHLIIMVLWAGSTTSRRRGQPICSKSMQLEVLIKSVQVPRRRSMHWWLVVHHLQHGQRVAHDAIR